MIAAILSVRTMSIVTQQKASLLGLSLLLFSGCLGMPEGVEPVNEFELDRYLGKWYEIARLDHSFERGLSQVTAEYTLNENGTVTVENRGFSAEKSKWKDAEGKARLVDDPQNGHLKVSFFGPFYASYVIFDLDKENYQYAFVSGPDTSYLWLLSRTPEVDEELLSRFIAESKKLGFDTDNLIFVEHDQQ